MAETAIKQLSDEQLVHRVLQREHDLVDARFRLSMNQLENTAQISVIRKDIARLRTEARVREKANGLPKDALLGRHGKTFAAGQVVESATEQEKGGFLSGIVDKLTGKE